MTKRSAGCSISPIVILLLIISGMAFAQVERQTRTLLVNGHSGQAAVIQENGHSYVDLEALARIANGSLSFNANQIVLTLSQTATCTPTIAAVPAPADDTSLSREFMKAGIEEIALMREWASPLAYAIQNGYPLAEESVTGYREQAAQGLRMASVAASTTADRNALKLLSNEFDGVREWSNKLIAAQKAMDTAKYSMSPGSLRNEPQSQKLITCWRFLDSMLGSGSFQDDSSCH
jgi:hypothetical protein